MNDVFIPVELYHAAVLTGESLGYCTACGAMTCGVEPDACEYECAECGQRTVYGLEELMIMGCVG